MTWLVTKGGDLINADYVVSIYEDMGEVHAETADNEAHALAVQNIVSVAAWLATGVRLIGKPELVNKKERAE